jgi:hypothetical protein
MRGWRSSLPRRFIEGGITWIATSTDAIAITGDITVQGDAMNSVPHSAPQTAWV